MQRTRRAVQLAFVALVVWGVLSHGAVCERWCPMGGVEAMYAYATEGTMLCSLGTSNFFILGGVLLMTLLLRRAFCSYMCPIGAISEWLRNAGARLRAPMLRVSPGVDRWLSMLKYPVLGAILYLTWRAGELVFRGFDPCYALISRHGTDITVWAYVVLGAILVASLFIVLPFCRWLCPLAAVLNPFSRLGLTGIRRAPGACTHCGACAKACPVLIPVDRVERVTAARCTSCMTCVEKCPHRNTGALAWGPTWLSGQSWPQAVLVVVLLLCTSGAVAGSYLFPLPSFVKSRGTRVDAVATCSLKIDGIACRGSAMRLWYYLTRDDMFQISGYLELQAWPGSGPVDVRVLYDPADANEGAICRAITEPYYDVLNDRWRMPPFRIEGYDPLSADWDDLRQLDVGGGLPGIEAAELGGPATP